MKRKQKCQQERQFRHTLFRTWASFLKTLQVIREQDLGRASGCAKIPARSASSLD
jgi:hypothetical protein